MTGTLAVSAQLGSAAIASAAGGSNVIQRATIEFAETEEAGKFGL